ncbi:hypothetical protein ACJX0J_004659, partial [Zea mays]
MNDIYVFIVIEKRCIVEKLMYHIFSLFINIDLITWLLVPTVVGVLLGSDKIVALNKTTVGMLNGLPCDAGYGSSCLDGSSAVLFNIVPSLLGIFLILEVIHFTALIHFKVLNVTDEALGHPSSLIWLVALLECLQMMFLCFTSQITTSRNRRAVDSCPHEKNIELPLLFLHSSFFFHSTHSLVLADFQLNYRQGQWLKAFWKGNGDSRISSSMPGIEDQHRWRLDG